MCLFCFDRIRLECSNLCPGCRTEYGSEKDPYQKGESRQRGTPGSSSGGATPRKHRASTSQHPSPMPSPSRHQTIRSQPVAPQIEEPGPPDVAEPSVLLSRSRSTGGQHNASSTGQGTAWEAAPHAEQVLTPAAQRHEGSMGQPAASMHFQDTVNIAGPSSSLHQATGPDEAASSAEKEQHTSVAGFRWPSASEALQSAAMRVGWGSWRLQKRRSDTPAVDPEVKTSAHYSRCT